MNEEPPSSQPEKSWLEKFIGSFSGEPQSREELLNIIKDAATNELLDEEALEIIEGALEVSGQQVREIMIPRPQMVTINIDEPPEAFLERVIDSGHSRFPIIGENIDDIHGILLAKDLLPLILKGHQNFTLASVIRQATIIPESKRLNVLLREFRANRYHMALVIDEYGGISGLITIEDILEEIVGEISDETDDEQDDVFIRKVADNDYIIKALTPIEEFNEYFESGLNDEDFGTIGGLLMKDFGHLPQRNETTVLSGFEFRVLYSDSRQVHLLRLSRVQQEQQKQQAD
ncbi:magnesium/cobalt efflux protein [Candidatus Endobugula sertula]|uniref:Magnesium and cobalt efflux protein CorC n=1 Tax=Candidatus Endobugula sertula TaxID=62101 RepID=A0A1D2QLS6_9GAMM|nr:magnesium/cobalt efflux protein [Candidatus Endobugula sertula]